MSDPERVNSVESTPAPDGQYHGLVLDFGGVLTTSFDGAQCQRAARADDR